LGGGGELLGGDLFGCILRASILENCTEAVVSELFCD
jgi:hypothetical protein